MSDGNELLMQGGIPSAKFAIKGAQLRGSVTALPSTRPITVMGTQEVKRFSNGDPMMQVVVQVQTEERDPTIEGDDGVRATYIRYQNIARLREAIRRAGAKGLEVGGYLTQTYVSDTMPTGGVPYGIKLHDFTYSPPNVLDQAETHNAAAQGYNVPVAQAAPASANPLDALNDEQRKALAALGFKG